MYFMRFLMEMRSTLALYLTNKTYTNTLSETCKNAAQRKLHIVIGNESCDLDSAVSAVTLAFIYAMRYKQHDYVPVLNITRTDYPLKTEVKHLFKNVGIAEQMLVFRDDLPSTLPSQFDVILVDHHVSNISPNVVEIFDHRPLEKHPSIELLPVSCIRNIKPHIGSCATLISELYFAGEEPHSINVAKLLHATIVLDTINFSPTAKRFSLQDLNMVEQLEQLLFVSDQGSIDDIQTMRGLLFEELVTARADISELTLTEVLRKDMKMLHTEHHAVPIAGLPMLVRHFIDKPNAEASLREFGKDLPLLIILGMYVSPTNGEVQRDIGLISLNGQRQMLNRCKDALLEAKEPSFELQLHDKCINFMNGSFFRQLNVQATRKHILPVIKTMLLEWENSSKQWRGIFF